MGNRKGKFDKISNEEFKQLTKSSISCADLMRKLGYKCTTGGGYLLIKRKIKELGLDISHWKKYNSNKNELTLEEVLVNNVPRSTHIVKKKLIKFNVIPYKCSICGNEGIWNNIELVLQLDHINGDNTDNRIENLRFLCPNCHSQTSNFGSKNIKRKTN